MNILNQLRLARNKLRKDTEELLYQRNEVPLSKQHSTDGFEIRETKRTDREGNVALKFELWQRIDTERVILSSDIKLEVVTEEEKEADGWY